MADGEPTTDRWRAAAIAWSEGLEGRFRSMEQLAWRLQSDAGCESRAWGHALRALRWHAEPEMGRLPTIDELGEIARASEEAAHAAGLAAAQAAKAHALAFDVEGLRRWAAFVESHLASATGEARAFSGVARAWAALAMGDHEGAEARATEACADASAASASAALIDATALLALATSLRDVEAAIEIARRGSRMARTESLPQGEYLANVVLARLRRVLGRPHHATRILTALGRVASPPWRPWIAWELALAGGLDPAGALLGGERNDAGASASASAGVSASAGASASAGVSASAGASGSAGAGVHGGRSDAAATALVHALFAARDGARAAFDAHAALATDAIAAFEPLARDVASTFVAVDPSRASASAAGDVRAWLEGTDARTPALLRGLGGIVEASSADEGTAAFVFVAPGRAARRVVALGQGLAVCDLRIEPQRGRPGRVETILAALALSTDGLDTGDLFRTVYGFEYSAALHRDLFKQLVYRARAELGHVGTIDKDGDRYRLALTGALLVPDPRCEQPLEDLVLRFLARHGAESAKATASTLKISLRKAQQALAQLADEGAIEIDKDGRKVSYRLEDTTFSEPTRV